EKALAAMLGIDGIADCEIIVVDDGSTDATPAVLEGLAARHPGIVRFTRRQNAGPGVARNTGLGMARRERILFLDDDVFPEPGLLRAHARFLDQGFDLSQGVLTWHPDLADTWLMRYMDAHGMQFAFDRVENDEELSYLYVYTANLAVKAEKIREVGGFDSAFAAKRYAFEDTAFAYALKMAGCRLGLNREARAVH
ncbi:MAG: glycosyltransferase, partial [Desulfovibrio sp.]|nr:glycosyltransferase [Desulfovibrio sp.]